MITLTPQLTAAIASRLQIGNYQPTVRVELDKLDTAGAFIETVRLDGNACEVDSRLDVNADGLTVTFPLIAPGRHLAPDWVKEKFPDPNTESVRWAPQADPRYQNLLSPETPVRIYLGYGAHMAQVFTGSLDRIQIVASGENAWTVTVSARNGFKEALEARLLEPLVFEGMTVSTIISDLAARAGLTEQIIEETTITEDGQVVPYQVSLIQFEEGKTIGECIQQLCELVDMRAWVDHAGRLRLARLLADDETPSVYTIHGESNLVTMDYTLDGSLLRNHLIIVGEGGETSEFRSSYISGVLKGKVRTAKTTAWWLDTEWKRQRAAVGLFRRMSQLSRTIACAIPLHPGLEVGDIVQLHDIASTAAGRYQVVGVRHTVNEGGALTQLDLAFLAA